MSISATLKFEFLTRLAFFYIILDVIAGSTEKIGNNVVLVFHMRKFRALFFDEDTPTKHPLSIEIRVSQIFVIGKNIKIATIQHGSKLA